MKSLYYNEYLYVFKLHSLIDQLDEKFKQL